MALKTRLMTSRFSSWLPLARLLRLPNVFTAQADILLTILITLFVVEHHGDTSFVWRAILIYVASSFFYLGGMVWNDYFDQKEDLIHRPFRPIPSGQIRSKTALRIALLLSSLGLFTVLIICNLKEEWDWSPLGIASGLLVAILLYNGLLKSYWIGPFIMALCRFIHIFLGFSISIESVPFHIQFHLASIIGLYILGITYFARQEEQQSQSNSLRFAAGIVAFALIVALGFPLQQKLGESLSAFPYLLVGFGFYIGRPIFRAIQQPNPRFVQQAVKTSILGLIILDSILATVFAGYYGLLLIVLLLPARQIGKWVYST